MIIYNWTWPVIIPVTDTGTIPPRFRFLQWHDSGTAIRLTPVAADAEQQQALGDDDSRAAEPVS